MARCHQTMPVPARAQPVDHGGIDHGGTDHGGTDHGGIDHQTRFQAAVDVIHNLPKDGVYRPSYGVMLRFYGLYKQAVCGPCEASRPGFWDPVGRYKWDAWSGLGAMSRKHAMAQYVEEMKKVAQEIIDTVPMNEKTASVFHHFEPLYVVIHDMPRPPTSLLRLREDIKDSDGHQRQDEDDRDALEEPTPETPGAEPTPETPGPEPTPETSGPELTPETPGAEPTPETPGAEPTPETPGAEQETGEAHEVEVPSTSEPQVLSEGVVLTSDSESEVFCDSLDSVELPNDVKAVVPTSNGLHNGHAYAEHAPSAQTHREEEAVSQATQVGAGQGGEGADDGKGPPMRRSRDGRREGTHHGGRERGVPPDSPRPAGRGAGRGPGSGGGGGGAGGGGGGGDGGPDRPQDTQVQQQIVLALRRLREDMRSVMDRLEVVERLSAAHAQSPDWRPCRHCAASNSDSDSEEEKWWPFDVSGRTVLLLLLWPFVAQGLVVLLRRTQRKNHAPV